jgi:hypothetical protein
VFDSGAVATVYEFFDRGPNGEEGGNPDTWDLAGLNIIFAPNGEDGWIVTVPEPATGALAVTTLGIFAVVGLARRGKHFSHNRK